MDKVLDSIAVSLFVDILVELTNIRRQDSNNYSDTETRCLVYSSILPFVCRLFVTMVTSPFISIVWCFRPYKPYIFWKLIIWWWHWRRQRLTKRQIQRHIDTDKESKTNKDSMYTIFLPHFVFVFVCVLVSLSLYLSFCKSLSLSWWTNFLRLELCLALLQCEIQWVISPKLYTQLSWDLLKNWRFWDFHSHRFG